LRQLNELAPESVIQAQLARDLLCDVNPVSAPGINVDFLQKQNVGIQIAEKIYDGRQLQTSVNVPVNNSDRTARLGSH